jgi:aminopeptidase YwaD
MKKLVVSLLLFVSIKASAQDVAFARKIVDTLTLSYFSGRGYTNNGMAKAAGFISRQFSSYGLTPVNTNSYFQPFTYPVNSFPGRMEVFINQKKLVPGKDFIVSPDSRGLQATAKLEQKDSAHFVNPDSRIIVSLENKLTWSVAPAAADYTTIQLDKKTAEDVPKNIQVDIENKEIPAFKAANVCGWVKGTVHPDSIIVISAHYDHLGGMGANTYFPGANDNASGTSLLLGLARYYAAHPQPYTIAFIAFAGEEAGLLGSKYFVNNPLFPLKNIRFLLNLDLEGTGNEGITVVNATEFPKEFATLNAVNDSGKYLVKINARGKAANSDHYWFTEKEVPAFFLYTLGGIKAYHDVFDKAETLPLNEYEDLFKLIIHFNEKLMK